MSLSKKIKTYIYGTIPYYTTLFFNPRSFTLKYYQSIHERGYRRFVFGFENEYDNFPHQVGKDEEKELYYVIHGNKRLYFKRNLPLKKIKGMYRALLIEQDIRSAHHYMDSKEEIRGKVFVDIGSAEGFSSLDNIEEASHIYLFEKDPDWLEALQATFEPWKEKVTIIRKFVGDRCDENHVTLDSIFHENNSHNLFLKMDIEGAERKALNGCKRLFLYATHLNFAICTYHLPDDKKIITRFLNNYSCSYINQEGYYRRGYRSILLRGCKNDQQPME